MVPFMPPAILSKAKKVQDILHLYAFMNERPSQISFNDMRKLLRLHKRTHVMSYLTKLRERERWKENVSSKIAKNTLYRRSGQLFHPENKVPIYGYPAQSLIALNNFKERRKLLNAAQRFYSQISDSPRVVLDFDYYDFMPLKSYNLVTTGLAKILNYLTSYENPPALSLCNFCPDHPGIRLIHSKLNLSEYILDLSPKSYLEKFPRERLVYLSPYSQQNLVYNPQDIYIVGAVVDPNNSLPLSLEKAQKEALRCAYLPIAEYLGLKKNRRKFQIETVFKIICDMHSNGGNFQAAVELLPKEKIRNQERLEEAGLMTN